MHRLVTTIATLGVCALASCSSPPPPPPVAANLGNTEGSVTFTGGAVALGIGFQWGSGTLTYQGREYPFSLNGLSVVDVGVILGDWQRTRTRPAQYCRFQRQLRFGLRGRNRRRGWFDSNSA